MTVLQHPKRIIVNNLEALSIRRLEELEMPVRGILAPPSFKYVST